MSDDLQTALRDLTGEVKANTAITADLKASFDRHTAAIEPRLHAVEDKTNAIIGNWRTLKAIGALIVGAGVIAAPVVAIAHP